MRLLTLLALFVVALGLVVDAGSLITADNVSQLSRTQAFAVGSSSFNVFFLLNNTVAVTSEYGHSLWMLESENAAPVCIDEREGRIIALSSDLSLFALYLSNRKVEVWSIDPMEKRISLGPLRSMARTDGAFTQNGGLFAVFNNWNRVDVWDLETGERRYELTGLRSNAFDLAFSPDGTLLAAAGGISSRDDRGVSLICVWSSATGELVASIPTDDMGDNHAVLFTTDGAQLISTGHQRLWAWNTDGWTLAYDSGRAYPGSYGISLSPDGSLLAIASDERTVLFYDIGTMKKVHAVSIGASVNDVDFSPDGTQLAVACGNGVAQIWSVPLEGS